MLIHPVNTTTSALSSLRLDGWRLLGRSLFCLRKEAWLSPLVPFTEVDLHHRTHCALGRLSRVSC